mgnify:CR=1 FL=1
MVSHINTEDFSAKLRQKSIDIRNRRLLITRISGSEQERDLTEPPNCDGVGRIRHFHRHGSDEWPENPLPIDPACKSLGLPRQDTLRAQVFQNSSCNWRCWYCYVPFSLLDANPKYSSWLSAAELVDLYLEVPDRPNVIDLTGGQPDLVPEWIPWMMKELIQRGLSDQVYLWSDDNMSNDYFWRFLSDEDRDVVCQYRRYGKVCCFKGFNAKSFEFNTHAAGELFESQFEVFKRYVGLGIDVYAYVTLTTPTATNIPEDMKRFVDQLQAISPSLPLRTVPLEIRPFSPMTRRMNDDCEQALVNQRTAIDAWRNELTIRFGVEDLRENIFDVGQKARPQ